MSSVAVSSPEGFVSRGAAHERIENAACLCLVLPFFDNYSVTQTAVHRSWDVIASAIQWVNRRQMISRTWDAPVRSWSPTFPAIRTCNGSRHAVGILL